MLYALSQIGLIVLAIVILVTIHELGHFWAARMFGIKVETFSIFFPPKIWSFKWGETEWQIGTIPLGGFVKIAGMIDESMDEEQMKKPIEPWEFRAKPVWQRAIVMLGGIIMNVILGFVIFIGLKLFAGDTRTPLESQMKYGIFVEPHTAGDTLGFKTGDVIVGYKGQKLDYVDYVMDPNFLVDRNKTVEVLRNGKEVSIPIANDFLKTYQNLPPEKQFLFGIDGPAQIEVIDSFKNEAGKWEKTPAFIAGLDSADIIVKIDSTPVALYSDVKNYMRGKKNTTFLFTVQRGGATKELTVKSDSNAKIGIGLDEALYRKHIDYSFGEALVEGPSAAMRQVSRTVKGLYAVIVGNSDRGKSLNSFIKISQVMKQSYDNNGWVSFWILTGLLSMVLAVMNLLPIPALDGGHVVFLLFEAITGKEPSLKFRMIAQQVGMILLLALMAYIIIKDIITY